MYLSKKAILLLPSLLVKHFTFCVHENVVIYFGITSSRNIQRAELFQSKLYACILTDFIHVVLKSMVQAYYSGIFDDSMMI